MRLSGHQVKQLSTTSNARAFADLALHLAAFAAVIGAAHALHHPVAYLVAMVLVGGLQNRLIIHAHEAWHRKAFTPVALNQFMGKWIYSYPVGVPFLSDQSRHLAHHRSVGRSEDPDFRDYERAEFHESGSIWRFLAGQFLGMKVLLRLTGRSSKPIVSEAARAAEKRELLGIVVCQAALFAVFVAMGRWWEYFVLWAVPLGTVTSGIVAFRAYVEHAHTRAEAGPHDRLYDFDAGPLTRFFVSPLYFHWHALHHAYPSVPYSRLRELKRVLSEESVSYPHRDRPTYFRCLLELERDAHAQEDAS